MLKNQTQVNKKKIETMKMQLIAESMYLHSLLRIDKLLKEIKAGVRIYAACEDILDCLVNNPKINIHSIIRQRKKTDKELFLIFASDKGFCGEYNKKLIEMANQIKEGNNDYIIYGNKFVKKNINIIEKSETLEQLGKDSNLVLDLVKEIISDYYNGKYNKISIIHNDYLNTSEYVTKKIEIIPNITVVKKEKKEYYADYLLENHDIEIFYYSILEKVLYWIVELKILSSLTAETVQRNIIAKGAKDRLEEISDEIKKVGMRIRTEKITGEINDINNAIILKKKKKRKK